MGIAISICYASSIKVSLISVLNILNGGQFLNATFELLLAPSALIFPVTKIYESE